ncbi:TIGR02996 domain-containing protein [Pyxidicoccus parkwayensis]|uniref:TIGR02996 domain-containing protein n=1 Tax=Pyxidicoccus parkwayensis TaxID=2813578 RepID=A0ABX7NUK9_9BACT|nr:TIGR02996 domain-containing protein [Pyxidicoccus parkwaysis]QSQ19808.1 TIGR02996 domain-containing protein [Pyxidicoccus parkwaysis]
MANVTLNELLGLAVESFDHHEEAKALEHLLEAWRLTRSECLAVLIERLSKRLTLGMPPLVVDTHIQMSKRSGPLDLPRFMAHVVALADRAQWGQVFYLLENGVRRLPEDPRLTAPLLDLVQRPDAVEQRTFRALCDVFSAMRDPRALTSLRALGKTLHPGSPHAEWLDMTLRSFTPEVPLGAEEAASCAALENILTAREEAETRRSPTHEALLARVYADPGDTSARMVLADHLLEQGNPLGEFIMLQCSPRSDRQRIARLLEEHGGRWASALGPHVDIFATRFERGFPSAVRLRADWRAPLPPPGPEWATVREVDVAGAMFQDLAAWLSLPELRTATVLKRVEPRLVSGFGAQGLGVRQLGLSGPALQKAPSLLRELEQLPSLSRLLIHDADAEDMQACAASPMAARLERFEARGGGAWTLVAAPAKGAPLRAVLLLATEAEPFARVLRGAMGFGRGALHVRVRDRVPPEGLRLLEAAASSYARVEWS